MAMLPPPQAMNPINAAPDESEMPGMDEQEPVAAGAPGAGGAAAFGVSPGSMLLAQLAIQLRSLQLISHNAHNLINGPNFFADHEFCGELYVGFEKDYDQTVERLIGLGTTPNLVVIQQKAVAALQELPPDAEGMFAVILDGVKALQELFEQFEGQASMGTVNLIASMADAGEVLAYKLQQRLGGGQK